MWIWNKKTDASHTLKNYMAMDKLPVIQGYSFDKPFNFFDFLNQYIHMGFQGSHVGIAISLWKDMLALRTHQKTAIFLSFTGNMISSGNREIITYLVKHKIVAGIVTTAAAVEEDIIKCIKPFHLGNFDTKGAFLLNECVGRIGNIFAPFDRYLYLERVLNAFFTSLHIDKHSPPISTHQFTHRLGLFLKDDVNTKEMYETSFLFWATHHNIPVFCPGITDGAIGDIAVFFKQNNPAFAIDSVADNVALTDILLNTSHACSIILGGGIAKHFLLNAAIFRDGFDMSIYITTAPEYDGSDSGGNPEEAITWAKIKPQAKRVKVVADATIVFPLLIAAGVSPISHSTKPL